MWNMCFTMGHGQPGRRNPHLSPKILVGAQATTGHCSCSTQDCAAEIHNFTTICKSVEAVADGTGTCRQLAKDLHLKVTLSLRTSVAGRLSMSLPRAVSVLQRRYESYHSGTEK
jgi:hypothetical protein